MNKSKAIKMLETSKPTKAKCLNKDKMKQQDKMQTARKQASSPLCLTVTIKIKKIKNQFKISIRVSKTSIDEKSQKIYPIIKITMTTINYLSL